MARIKSPRVPVALRAVVSRCAIVGSGAFAALLAARLRELRTGRVDVFGSAGRQRSPTLTLTDVARYDVVFVTDDDAATVARLNESCLLASVHLVVVGMHGDRFAVSSYPFASGSGAACHSCNAGHAARFGTASEINGAWNDATVSHLAAGFALTFAPPAISRVRRASRRLVGSASAGRVDTLDVMREPGCAVCGEVLGTVRIVRARNRWSTPAQHASTGSGALEQTLQLSEAIVTGASCNACGVLGRAPAAQFLNRNAAEFATQRLPCPTCGTGSLHLESRRDFSLGELVERFGDRPVPVRYALASIGAGTVCFDFSDDAGRATGHWSMESGVGVAGAAVGAGTCGATLVPEDGCIGAGAAMTSNLSTK